MKSFAAQQDCTGAYINICLRRFRRAWQLSRPAQKQEQKRGRKGALSQTHTVDIQGSCFRPIARECRPGATARVTCAVAATDCTKTAGRAPTHQWTRQGVCRPCSNALAITACADTVQTRKGDPHDKAAFIGITGHRPHDGKSREGVLARVSNHVFHSVEAVGRARGHAIEPSAKRGSCALCVGFGGRFDRGRWVPGPAPAARPYIDLSTQFRADFFQEFFWSGENFGSSFSGAAAPSKIWRRPVSKILVGAMTERVILIAGRVDRGSGRS